MITPITFAFVCVCFLFVLTLALDVCSPARDANGMPEDFPNDDDLEAMDLITQPNRELGEA